MLAEWTSKWFKVKDNKNNIVIDNFDYKNGIQGPIILKHCVKCVAINQCWFIDEIGKKPEEAKYGIGDIIKTAKNMLGLYHFNCHCKKIDIPEPKESDIKLIIPQGKIDWLFKDKSGWIKAMGHEPNNEFLEYLKNQIRTSYTSGKYYIMKIDNHGVAIGIQLIIKGAREKRGKTYQVIFTDTRPFREEIMFDLKGDIVEYIEIKDLEVVEESNCTDEYLLINLPNQEKRWFCKVENGFIVNLLGEKLNKIPYDYDS